MVATAFSRLGWLFILILAAVPRLTSLNRFLIVDEPGRWEWAKQFFIALVSGNPAGTMIHGYPGVLPDWLSSAWIGLNALWRSWQQGEWLGQTGLHVMLHEWNRVPQHLADQRWGVVVGNTLLVLVAYLLIRRAFGSKIALVSGVLIALDPFYLTDSRINRAEGLTAGVVFASLLLFVLYVREGKWRWLLLSGLVAGLACLAKIQAFVIWPILGLIALIYWLTATDAGAPWQRVRHWAVAMAVWSLALILTFWVAWPAMWVMPGDTLQMVYDYVAEQSGAKGVNLFFLGRVIRDQDPGPLFYPVAFLLRVSPLVLLGLVSAGWAWWRQRDRSQRRYVREWVTGPSGLWVVTAFALLYPAVMTLGSHKQDRYLMTIFPMASLLAATGLLWLWERIWHKSRVPEFRLQAAGLGGLLLVQLLVTAPFHPYYYPYFNPLVGNGRTAPGLIRIGWGEGLDQVADYLNRLPNRERLVVASRFPRHLVGYQGQVVPLDAGGEWTQADYVVFYIHQVQRQQDPGPGEIRWLQRYRPEHMVRLGGIEYAWVYENPITVPADPQVSQQADQLQFFGYVWEEAEPALRLVWLNEQTLPDRQMKARLGNDQITTPWLTCEPAPGFANAAQTSGEVVESWCSLTDLPSLPSGLYHVEVGVAQDKGEVVVLPFPQGRASASVGLDGALVHLPLAEALEALGRAALPGKAVSSEAVYGDQVRLVGYRILPPQPHPGDTVRADLYWQALKSMETDYGVFVHLLTNDETRVAAADVRHPTSQWTIGDVQPQRYQLALPTDISAPSVLRMDVGLQDETLHLLRPTTLEGKPLPWTVARLKITPEVWPDTDGITPVPATFDADSGSIGLAGYRLIPSCARPGDTLTLTLYWQPQATPGEDYTVFVQLVNPQDQVVAQGDGPPRGGAYPTSWWAPGETIADTHLIPLSPDLPPGDYRLITGLYRLADGTRLPAQAEAALGADALLLAELEVGSP